MSIILTSAMMWGTVSKTVCRSQAAPDSLAYLHHLIYFGHNRRLRRSLVNIPLSFCFPFSLKPVGIGIHYLKKWFS